MGVDPAQGVQLLLELQKWWGLRKEGGSLILSLQIGGNMIEAEVWTAGRLNSNTAEG